MIRCVSHTKIEVINEKVIVEVKLKTQSSLLNVVVRHKLWLLIKKNNSSIYRLVIDVVTVFNPVIFIKNSVAEASLP